MTKRLTSCPICTSNNLKKRNESLRDSDVIGVAECNDCSHIFLDSFEHINEEYFEENQFLKSKKDMANTIDRRLRHFEAENRNRYERVAPLVANKRVIEIGTGAGALIDMIAPLAEQIVGIERTVAFCERLMAKGYDIRQDLSQCPDDVDVVLSFHVLEHVADPVGMLRESYSKLAPGGLIYLEVPNIDDALLSLYEIEEYRRFYFFKDHLHYFSRRTLEDAFRIAGLPRPQITGHNRFGLGNHLHWLKTGMPGGHVKWSFLEAASDAYSDVLAANDLSDSLVAHVRKPVG